MNCLEYNVSVVSFININVRTIITNKYHFKTIWCNSVIIYSFILFINYFSIKFEKFGLLQIFILQQLEINRYIIHILRITKQI